MPFVDLINRPDFRLARNGSLLVAFFNGATTVADLDALGKHQQALAKELGHLSMISLVPSGGAAKVSDEVKAKSVEIVRAVGPQMVASATVLLGKGLGATVIRAFMTGFNLLSKSPAPQKTFADAAEALAWLKAAPKQTKDVQALELRDLEHHFKLQTAMAA